MAATTGTVRGRIVTVLLVRITPPFSDGTGVVTDRPRVVSAWVRLRSTVTVVRDADTTASVLHRHLL